MKSLILREWILHKSVYIVGIIMGPIMYLLLNGGENSYFYFFIYPISFFSIVNELNGENGMYLLSSPITRRMYLHTRLLYLLAMMIYIYVMTIVMSYIILIVGSQSINMMNVLFYSTASFFVMGSVTLIRLKLKVQYGKIGGNYFWYGALILVWIIIIGIFITTNIFNVDYEFMNVLFDTKKIEILFGVSIVSTCAAIFIYKGLANAFDRIEI